MRDNRFSFSKLCFYRIRNHTSTENNSFEIFIQIIFIYGNVGDQIFTIKSTKIRSEMSPKFAFFFSHRNRQS